MLFQHTTLAEGRWQTLSLAEQMGNIGSEVIRTLQWKNKDQKIFQRSLSRALELFDLTINDSRWQKRLKEILRAREVFCDVALEGGNYRGSLETFERYFFHFARFARLQT